MKNLNYMPERIPQLHCIFYWFYRALPKCDVSNVLSFIIHFYLNFVYVSCVFICMLYETRIITFSMVSLLILIYQKLFYQVTGSRLLNYCMHSVHSFSPLPPFLVSPPTSRRAHPPTSQHREGTCIFAFYRILGCTDFNIIYQAKT